MTALPLSGGGALVVTGGEDGCVKGLLYAQVSEEDAGCYSVPQTLNIGEHAAGTAVRCADALIAVSCSTSRVNGLALFCCHRNGY